MLFIYLKNNINILHIIELNSFLYHFKIKNWLSTDLPYVDPYYKSLVKTI